VFRSLFYRLSRRLTLLAVTACAVPLVVAVSLPAATSAEAGVPSLPQHTFGKGIEPMAAYVEQTSCHPGYRAGTLALGRLLTSTYRNTSFQGAYDCGTDGNRSEHYDGRAVDWMNSVRNPTQAAQAAAVLSYLFRTDKYGNTFANARRMGVMYIIWDNRIWGAWNGKWSDYNGCAKTPAPGMDNACHRNHMHISLSWAGALGRTEYWSGRVYSGNDYGPCRPRDLNWAANYAVPRATRCPSFPLVAAPPKSSPAMQTLVPYSGAVLQPGMGGEPVKSVQRAFKLPITGRYDAVTVAKITRFKHAYGLPANGTIDLRTWRLMLAAFRPR
jgi:hypothetical protein